MGIIRKTKSIEVLLNEFEKTSQALSTVELIKSVDKEMNKTTVYRVLDKLEDDGVVHSFLGANGVKWYAKCKKCSKTKHTDIHPHFQCLSCGKAECLEVEVSIPEITNKEILFSQVLLQGTCESCSDLNI